MKWFKCLKMGINVFMKMIDSIDMKKSMLKKVIIKNN